MGHRAPRGAHRVPRLPVASTRGRRHRGGGVRVARTPDAFGSAQAENLFNTGGGNVRAAMARSIDLTRRHLLVTVVVVTVPVAVEHEILDALDILWDFPFVVLSSARTS
jgi:hypothetical protein